MTDWQEKARAATVRKNRMMSFGPYARGLLIEGKRGLFVVDPEDSSVTGWLLSEGTYAENELALASSFLGSKSDVLIVGTHIGALAIPLSKQCKSMDVVEANPDTQRLLKANLLLNECANVTLHPIAASDSRDPISFLKNRDNSGGSKRKPLVDHVHYVYDEPEVVTLDAWPLDQRLGDKSYDLIIMDIEGSEYFALKGMPKILTNARAMAIEFLPHHIKDVAGVSIADFCQLLQPNFNWMYIPGKNALIPSEKFMEFLSASFDAGHGYDAIYLMKDAPDAWMRVWNVHRPGAD
ncbi:MAG TPA: FkbM family methyltransferase [Rhizobium sp.]